MQTKPASWGSIFSAPHKTEYRYDIDGVSYYRGDCKEPPIIKKPLMDKPAIGRCCTGSLQLKVFPKSTIPKAATVNAYCRLRDSETDAVTEWIPQGKFYVTQRKGKNVLTLTCADRMIKAGQTYLDKTAFTTWPQPMTAVLSEICSLMEVTLDSRTVIKTGADYQVDYPNEDTLISEILRNIAAAHGGNWIMTESGKLRLIVLSSPSGVASQVLEKEHGGLEELGKLRKVSRVILTDSANNEFTAGNDSDLIISAGCEYATQAIANNLCAESSISIENGCLVVPGASMSNGKLNISAGAITNGCLSVNTASVLYGVTYQPYSVAGAYLDPAIELGDTISIRARDGTEYRVVVFSLDMNCTISATCSLSASIDDETEDEYPYITMQELSLSRSVKTNQTYYGNRINRSEGFVSELLVNGAAQARLTANASVFSMQSKNNGAWVDRIYFDPISGKYVITGDVTVQGLANFENSLAQNGSTVINGGNISTGIIQSHDGRIKFNLDTGVFSVADESLEDVLEAIDNDIQITATAQMFTKAQGASSYSPASITFTAQSEKTLASYQWYKNNTAISGATNRTLTISPSDISGTSATYKVIGTDSDSNTYSDIISVAKLADGTDGAPGQDGRGISSTSITYGVSDNDSTAPSSWSQNVPTSLTKGKWLWVKTVLTYTDSTKSTSYNKSYIGTDGEDGVSLAVQSATKTGGVTTVVIVDSEGHETTLTINDGEDGDNGTPGTDGLNGYVHTAWANSADGTTDFSTSVSANKKYLGVYTDNTAADSQNPASYSWSLIKGTDGQNGQDGSSVTVQSIKYGTSDTASTQPTNWSTSVPTSITKGKWLWVKTTYSDSTTVITKSYVGTDGEDGKSVAVQSATKTGGTTTVVLVDSDGNTTTLTIDDGQDGNNGQPGANGYVHTAWANSADGQTDFSTSVSAGKKYLGVYTDNTAADSQTYSDYSWSLIKGADGQDGQDGAPGQDSYTALLSNEYIEIPVDSARKPLSAKTYSCVVSVYKGLTAMTATKSTPTAGKFKVTPGTAPTGVTVAQSTAGTITLTVAKTTAISDSAELPLTITVYGGITLNTKIAIHANMNSVTVANEASITTNAGNIALCVRSDSVISTINQSAELITISADKIDLSGYVTISSLSTGSTTINGGCITTGTIDASDVSIINLDAGNIVTGTLSADYISGGTLDFDYITAANLDVSDILANGISADYITSGTLDCSQITVSGLSASDISSGSLSADYISGGTLNFNDIAVSNLSASNITTGTLDCSKVIVSKLSASSITTGTLDCSKVTVSNLSASSISSGTIDAARINVDTLYVNKLYNTGGTKKAMIATDSIGHTVYVGGDGSWGGQNVFIYGSSEVGIGAYNAWGQKCIFDCSNKCFRPDNATYGWTLGSSSYPWGELYTKESCIGTSSGKVGFFGTTPTSKKTCAKPASGATLAQLTTTVNTLITALQDYGLLKNY